MAKTTEDRYRHYGRARPRGCNCEPPAPFVPPDDATVEDALGAWMMQNFEESILDSFYKAERPCPVHGTDSFYHMKPDEVEPDPELIPCPMCGSKAKMVYGNDSRGSMGAEPPYHFVRCCKCGASGPQVFQYYDAKPGHTKKRAAKLWNRRPRG